MLFAIVIPLGAWVLDQAAEVIAEHRGENRTTRIMREPRRWVSERP